MNVIDKTIDFYKLILRSPLSSVVSAVIIILLGLFFGKLVGRIIKQALHEIDLDKNLKKAGFKIPLENIISSFATYLIYFVGLVLALNQFKIVVPAIYVVSGIVAILIIVSFLLSIKDFIPNFFAGLHIYRRDMYRKGDKIKYRNLSGIVQEISLTETKIKTKSGDSVFIPNRSILKNNVVKLKK